MNKVNFLMAIHFHQPIGNFNFVFEKVCKNCYQPFIKSLQEFPDIKLTLHFTGCLLEWLEANNPEILGDIKQLTKRGQIEVMTGGFYEPILPVMPYRDAVGQINMLSDFVKNNFNYQPQGAWIAERVWEPQLPSLLNDAGVKYVILDDFHLKQSGILHDGFYGYYITEDRGKTTAVFPSDKKLRYSVPFSQPGQVIDYLKSIAKITDGLAAVYGDDAEKFGEWPGTHEWVYEKRWLHNFFLALRQNSSWLKTAHISEYLNQNEPLGRVYIPTASYEEMAEWSGSFWRSFLTKYPESNQMYKKMLRVSEKIARLENRDKRAEEARRELYRGQCNCAYWHGVFGGLYLYHLRSAIWEHLIKAEAIVDELTRKLDPVYWSRKRDPVYWTKGQKGWVDCEIGDFDSDGCDEAIISNSVISLFCDADEGGSITELDFKPKALNIVNTLSRRKELYHARLLAQSKAKDKGKDVKTIHERSFENVGLADRLFYDWYRRSCLLDHFLGASTTIDNFSKCQYEESGDFVNQPFKIDVGAGFKPAPTNGVVLKRDGQVNGKPVQITKVIHIKKDSGQIEINYSIKNTSEESMDLWFGSEFNFSLTNDDTFEQLFAEKGLTLKDAIAGININISFSEPVGIWRFPVKTISQSESDIEENYQSSAVLAHWKFKLASCQAWDAKISLALC